MEQQPRMNPLKNSFLRHKRPWILGIGVVIFLLLMVLMKSCGKEVPSTTVFTIGEDPQWGEVDVMGKQRELAAFNKSVLSELGKEQQVQFKVAIIPHINLVDSLEDGDVMGIISDLELNDYNEHYYLFSDPLILWGPVLIVPSSRAVSWEEKSHRIIGVEKSYANDLDFNDQPSLEMRLYTDILKGLSDLNNGTIDAAVFSAFPAATYVKSLYAKELKIVSTPLTDDGLRLVTLKNAKGEELIRVFNKGLEQLKASGTYDALLKKWGLIDPEKLASEEQSLSDSN